jgi:hypothetical protein
LRIPLGQGKKMDCALFKDLGLKGKLVGLVSLAGVSRPWDSELLGTRSCWGLGAVGGSDSRASEHSVGSAMSGYEERECIWLLKHLLTIILLLTTLTKGPRG